MSGGESPRISQKAGPMLTRQSFSEFARAYPSSEYENQEGGVTWIQSQAVRHFHILEVFARYRSGLGTGPIRILDVGAYPGTLLKSVRLLLKEEGEMAGVGLEGPPGFLDDLERYGIRFERANLDPIIRSADPEVEAMTQRIPYPDGHFDAVFCTEVLEHTLNPLHLLREIHRVTSPRGIYVMTTPNQARIGNRLKLGLFGESINYQLRESIMYMVSNWRPHIREYTMSELRMLMADAGFRVVEEHYLDVSEDDTRLHAGAPAGLRVAKALMRLFTVWPTLRHTILMVAQRA